MRKQIYPEVTVGPLIFNKKGELLLVKSRKWGDRLTIPGGHVELFESIEHATIRETLEETGLKVKNLKFVCHQEVIQRAINGVKMHYICFTYSCTASRTKIRPNEEISSYIWLRLSKALKSNIAPYVRYAIETYL